MNSSVIPHYALRSLARHARRTLLSVLGVAVGVAIACIGAAYNLGLARMMTRTVVESGLGHLRIAPAAWAGSHDETLQLAHWREVRQQVERDPAVLVAAPHARTNALLGFGTHIAGVAITGVDPAVEPRVTRYLRQMAAGRYLQADDTGAVIGMATATKLDVGVGDALMVTVVGERGKLASAMLPITGIVATGSPEIDATICQVTLPAFTSITGIRGVNEISVLLRDDGQAAAAARRLAHGLPAGDVVLTWQQIDPALAAMVKQKTSASSIGIVIMLLVVVLGVMSAQLSAALERRREFAMLAALGMTAGQIGRLLTIETLFLGAGGGLAGLLLGLPAVYYLATVGLNMSAMFHQTNLVFSNTLMDPVFYAAMGWWLAPLALGVGLGATGLASLYPAWFAARTDPAAAMRVN